MDRDWIEQHNARVEASRQRIAKQYSLFEDALRRNYYRYMTYRSEVQRASPDDDAVRQLHVLATRYSEAKLLTEVGFRDRTYDEMHYLLQIASLATAVAIYDYDWDDFAVQAGLSDIEQDTGDGDGEEAAGESEV